MEERLGENVRLPRWHQMPVSQCPLWSIADVNARVANQSTAKWRLSKPRARGCGPS